MNAKLPRVGYPTCTSWGIYGKVHRDARMFYIGPYGSEDIAEAMGYLLFWDHPEISFWNCQPWLPAVHDDTYYEWTAPVVCPGQHK